MKRPIPGYLIKELLEILSLKPIERLSKREKNKLDLYVWFCYNLLLRQYLKGKDYPTNFVGLSKKILSHFMTSSYIKIVKNLENNELIRINHKYNNRGQKKFSKSYSFRRNNIFLEGWMIYEFTSPPLLMKMKSSQKTKPDSKDDTLIKIFNLIKDFSISDKAIEWIYDNQDRLNPLKVLGFYHNVERIQNGNLGVSRDDEGRVYCNFTYLPKKLRKFITDRTTGDKLNLVEVDVTAEVAFILGHLLEKSIRKLDSSTIDFITLTQSEDFYRECYSALYCDWGAEEIPKDYDRKKFKDKIQALLNQKPEKNKKKKLYKTFKIVFPQVIQFIDDINRESNDQFYKMNIGVESKVMLESVYYEFALEMGNKAILLHDGLLVEPTKAEEVKQLIQQSYKEHTGSIPSVKVKGFKRQSLKEIGL